MLPQFLAIEYLIYLSISWYLNILFFKVQSLAVILCTKICYVYTAAPQSASALYMNPFVPVAVIFRITCYIEKGKERTKQGPFWLFTRFHCCPWHCPYNLQVIKQTLHHPTIVALPHTDLRLEVGKLLLPFLQCPDVSSGAWRGHWVTECLLTARMLAQIPKLLACVVFANESWDFRARKGLLATFKLQKENNSLVAEKDLECLGLWGTGKNKCP